MNRLPVCLFLLGSLVAGRNPVPLLVWKRGVAGRHGNVSVGIVVGYAALHAHVRPMVAVLEVLAVLVPVPGT